jgi:Type IV secretion-system coupling protein DNA-binding domain
MRLGTSPAAEFQALQTRAKIASQLWSGAARAMLLLWVLLTIWVIWHRVGTERPWLHHAYFCRWILCGILNDTPLLNRLAVSIPVPAAGAWYALPSFAAWLDNPQLYGASPYSWFARAAVGLPGYYGLGTDLFPIALLGLVILWRARRPTDGAHHIRGLQLVSPRRLNRDLHGGGHNRTSYSGIQLGQVVIPDRMLCEHLLITGSSGAGKSITIRSLLKQIAGDIKAAIIIDPDSEYVQEFYDESRGDIILNPLDQRCPYWSPWSEIRTDSFTVDAAAIAASLIRGKPRSNNEAFFQESTRTIIEAILYVVFLEQKTPTVPDLLQFLDLPRDKMHGALKDTPAYPLIDPNAAEQGAGILGTAANTLKTFVHLPKADEALGTWSAREYTQKQQGWIFLPSQEDIREAIQTLQGLWLDCLIRFLMSDNITNERQTFIIADEFASLGHQPQIEKLLTRSRKRGISVTLGLQNVAQLRDIYGRDAATTLSSAPSTKLILRTDETETAKWASELIGSHEVERLQVTQLAGLSTYREGVNLSPHRSVEPLVLPDEIKLLQPLTGYLCIAGTNRTTVHIPRDYLTKKHEPFIARAAVQLPTPPPPKPPTLEEIDQVVEQMKTRAPRSTLETETYG